MNCVFDSASEYARVIHEIKLDKIDFTIYFASKQLFQASALEYTDPALVTWIHGLIAKRHGFKAKIITRIWSKNAFLGLRYPYKYSRFQRKFIERAEWGVNVETLEEMNVGFAVYCSMQYAHAQFDNRPVPGTTLVIQWERQNDTY